MAVRKPSRLRRFSRLLIFRVVPVLMLGTTLWFSYGVAQAVARHMNEQSEASAREGLYSETLAALAPTLETFTPEPTASFTPANTATFTDVPTSTSTETSTATLTLTNTATTTPTATASLTPTPVPTETQEAVMRAAQVQVFATNTPHIIPVTIPALNTAIPATEAASPTATATGTDTPAPPPTATLEPAPTQAPAALPTLLIPPGPSDNANASAPTAIPTQVTAVDRHGYDIVNVLLLGGDDEITNDNVTRTDTMIVVSINRTTGTVSMLSLPRDLYVFIPGWTMQRLNLAFTHGEQVGWTGGGFGLLRQTIFYNLGINVHYYAIVNLSGFKEIIDTLGGVDVAVDCAIQDFELIDAPPPPEAGEPNVDGLYTLPVGFYHMNGGGALWYARSRHNSIDFDRGRRQQQILRAILRAARSGGQITQIPQLWTDLTQVVQTDLKFEDMLSLLPFALSLDPDRIENFTLPKPYYTTPWTPPDGSNVQLPNYDHIRELLEDFYQPPTESQVIVQGPRVEVYNGTANANLDRVAGDSLARNGFMAIASGAADNANYTDTVVIDRTGQSKGSKINDIINLLNVKPENVLVEPDPSRTTDFEVILGSNYTSCDSAVLPPQ